MKLIRHSIQDVVTDRSPFCFKTGVPNEQKRELIISSFCANLSSDTTNQNSYAILFFLSREWSISLRVSVILRVFAPDFDPPRYGVFGGKCTTVFGAINMLNAFARVEAVLCLLPLAKFAMRDPEWVRRRREKRQWGGKREEREKHQETKVGREDVGSGKGTKGKRGVNLMRRGTGWEAVDSSSNVTFGQNRRSLESNYQYARWKLRIIYASSLFDPWCGPAGARILS